MTFFRQTILIESGVKRDGDDDWDDGGDNVFTPALHTIARAPAPGAQVSVDKNFAAALSAATDHNQVLPNFVALGVERRKERECFGNLPDRQIGFRIVEVIEERVGRSLKRENRTGLADVRGRNEKLWRDGCPEKPAELPFVIPAKSFVGAVVFAAGSPVRKRMTARALRHAKIDIVRSARGFFTGVRAK